MRPKKSARPAAGSGTGEVLWRADLTPSIAPPVKQRRDRPRRKAPADRRLTVIRQHEPDEARQCAALLLLLRRPALNRAGTKLEGRHDDD